MHDIELIEATIYKDKARCSVDRGTSVFPSYKIPINNKWVSRTI